VDQVFLVGPHLLEIDRGWENSSGPQVRVALAEDPNQLLNRVGLTNLPFLGAALRDGHLYVAQGKSAEIIWQWSETEGSKPISTNAGVFSLSILDLAQLPALTLAGRTEVSTDEYLWGNWEALWPKRELLVWKPAVSGANYYGMPFPGGIVRPWLVDVTAPLPVVGVGYGFWGSPMPVWFWSNNSGRLVAFDVGDAAAPKFVSDLNLSRTENWNEFSRGFDAEGLVYLSHREYESKTTGTNYYVVTNAVVDTVTNIVTLTNVSQVPHVVTVTNYGTLTNSLTIAILNRLGEAPSPGPSPRAGVLAAGGHHELVLDAE